MNDGRAARGEDPVIAEPDPGWLLGAGGAPLEVADSKACSPESSSGPATADERSVSSSLSGSSTLTDTDDRSAVVSGSSRSRRTSTGTVGRSRGRGRPWPRRVGREHPMARLDQRLREQPRSTAELQSSLAASRGPARGSSESRVPPHPRGTRTLRDGCAPDPIRSTRAGNRRSSRPVVLSVGDPPTSRKVDRHQWRCRGFTAPPCATTARHRTTCLLFESSGSTPLEVHATSAFRKTDAQAPRSAPMPDAQRHGL